MMPPTSIDGTDITGATIDGTDVTEITVDGDTVFTAGFGVPNSAIARYTFDNNDTSGSTAIDVWGSNDGTINGPTTGIAGSTQTYDTGQAYEFDGTNDFVTTNADSQIEGLGAFSVAGWMYIEDNNANNMLASIDNVSNNRTFLLQYSTGAGNAPRFSVDTTGGYQQADGSTQVNEQEWYHYAGTYDGSTSKVYLDATEEGSGSISGTLESGPANFEIGRRGDNNNHCEGRISDVRVYDKALSSTEVSNLYNNGTIL